VSESEETSGLLSFTGGGDDQPIIDPMDSELVQMRQLGVDLVNYTFMSLRTLSMHSAKNEAVRLPLERLASTLDDLSNLVHSVHFIAVEGQVYLNDLRIRMESAAFENVKYLVNIFDRHGIGGISFDRSPSEDELQQLLQLLLKYKAPAELSEEQGGNLAGIRQALEEIEISGVGFDQPYFYKAGESDLEEGEGATEQEEAALAYAKGVLAVKDYFRAVEASEAANPLRIRKIVHDLVDVADAEGDDFLRLHTIHGVEDNYYNHCVNVASLAVAVGRYLGLNRVELSELGASAMFHDVGYAVVEQESLKRGEELSAEERHRLHSIYGFKSLLRQAEYGPALMRRLLVNLEHHMHYKRPGGFPNLGKKSLSVYTRILQVADHYDALVTPVEDQPGLLPVKALERIAAAAGTHFDPVVVKALVHVVGRYPYGSLVALNTGEVGVVTSGGRDPEAFASPLVMIVRNADGTVSEAREVDLFESSVLKRRVVEILDPYDEGITPHAVLFGDLKETQEAREEAEAEDEDEEAATPGESAEERRLAAWNEAILRGEDPVAATTGGDLSQPVSGTALDMEALEARGQKQRAQAPDADETREDAEGQDGADVVDAFAATDEMATVPMAAQEDADAETSDVQADTAAEPAAGDIGPEEEARRKAAWQKAMAGAFSTGGEEAVAKIAQMDWRDFGGDES